MKKNLVILFGGDSTEHDISIVSAFYVLKYINEYLYKPILIYIDRENNFFKLQKVHDIMEFTQNKKFERVQMLDGKVFKYKGKRLVRICDVDAVLPIMHGVNGEDGCIAGFLKLNNFVAVTPGIDTAVVGMDKALFKKCVSDIVPVLKCEEFTKNDLSIITSKCLDVKNNIGFPCIIKPARQGSSIGIEICENEKNFEKIIKKCLNFDKKIIIEPFLTKFREFNIAMYRCQNGIVASEIEEPILRKKMLSFEEKYLNFSGLGGEKIKNIPPKISKKLYGEIVDNASKVYEYLQCDGVIRFDFIYDTINKKLYLNEMNTIPGSLALYLFAPKDKTETEVLNDVIRNAERKWFVEHHNKPKYESNVLKMTSVAKFKK